MSAVADDAPSALYNKDNNYNLFGEPSVTTDSRAWEPSGSHQDHGGPLDPSPTSEPAAVPLPDQGRAIGASPEHPPAAEPPKKPDRHRYREAWDEFCAIRCGRWPGSTAIDYRTWERQWRSAVDRAGSTDRLLRAWRMVTSDSKYEWWQQARGKDLHSTFLRPKHLPEFLTASDEWNEAGEHPPNGADLTDDQLLAIMAPHRDDWARADAEMRREPERYERGCAWWQARVPAVLGWRMMDLQQRLATG